MMNSLSAFLVEIFLKMLVSSKMRCTFAVSQYFSTTDSVDAVEMMNHFPFLPALNQYLVDSIGSQYAPGEVCIPCPTIVACDNADSDSAMLVYGDFWVYNFNIAGDTLAHLR